MAFNLVSNICAYGLSLYPIAINTLDFVDVFNKRTPQSDNDKLICKINKKILTKEQIRKDFKIVSDDTFEPFGVSGLNYPAVGNVSVFMWDKLNDKEVDKDAYGFELLKRFYYLKVNSHVKCYLMSVVLTITTFVTTFFFFSSPWLSCLTTNLASEAEYLITAKKYKANAEDFAIQNASFNQLLGGVRYLEAIRDVRKTIAADRKYNSIVVEKIGNGALDFFNPSITTRIAKINTRIKQKIIENPHLVGQDIRDYDWKVKVNQIKICILRNLLSDKEKFGYWDMIVN